MAARRRRRKFKPRDSPRHSGISNAQRLIVDIENILSMPLPSTMVDCILEIEILTERQRAVGNRLRDLLHGNAQETEKIEKIYSLQNFDEQKNDVMIDQDVKSTTSVTRHSMGSKMELPVVSDMTNNDEKIKRQISGSPKHRSKSDHMAPKSYSRVSEAISQSLSDAFRIGDEETAISEQSSPLIIALKQLQHKHMQKKTVKKWIRNLASIFLRTDEDGNGYIDSKEYSKMISTLDLSSKLKWSLRSKFKEIDEDNSGDINLDEFLNFFLLYPKFNEEVLMCAHNNAPYSFESGLPTIQKWRLRIYNTMEFPEYSLPSKILYCLDLILTLIPTVVLCLEGVGLSSTINSRWNMYFWSISIFFAVQYVCGLLTCKSKKRFVTNWWHILDLFTFLFWIIENARPNPWTENPIGFFVLRTVRIVKLHAIFDIRKLRQDLEIYAQTIELVYTSYGAVTWFMLWIVIFFSVLVYAFERGSYDEAEGYWSRDGDEGESPFSELYNCLYFTMVTMTTLGYGDMFPKSYVGKAVSLFSACVGICNLTFMINIIGDCFEEMFRKFLLEKSMKADSDMIKYIEKHIGRACNKLRVIQGRAPDEANHPNSYIETSF